MNQLISIFSIPELKKRIYFILFIIFIYRLGGHIPISGVDILAITELFNNNGILGFFNLFSGGGLSRFSVFALGILPYINASIIMQLITIISPSIKQLAEEGESGKKQISQYTRYLAILIAFLQSIFMSLGFKSFILPDVNFYFFIFYSVLGLVAGATIVMWFGELINEYGVGNGASILIFIGIISELPVYFKNTIILIQGGTSIFMVFFMIFVFIIMIFAIVQVQEAERKLPIQYARKIVGRKMYGASNTFIPFRLIQGGVMPIIFASALLQFPLMFSQYIPIDLIKNFFATYYRYDGFFYNFCFAILIFFFTYFYTAITFNPKEISDNLKKYGGFIMGIRPGHYTELYLDSLITKLTLFGAVFLSIFALVPIISANITNVNSFMGLGGTALLIIVGVAIDIVRQIETFEISKKYEGMR